MPLSVCVAGVKTAHRRVVNVYARVNVLAADFGFAKEAWCMAIKERDVSVALRNMWHQKSSTELVMALASTGGHSEWCYMRC